MAKNEPAFPITSDDRELQNLHGLSKREWFAGMALQGFLANDSCLEGLAEELEEQHRNGAITKDEAQKKAMQEVVRLSYLAADCSLERPSNEND